jgi:hypothetical protein
LPVYLAFMLRYRLDVMNLDVATRVLAPVELIEVEPADRARRAMDF